MDKAKKTHYAGVATWELSDSTWERIEPLCKAEFAVLKWWRVLWRNLQNGVKSTPDRPIPRHFRHVCLGVRRTGRGESICVVYAWACGHPVHLRGTHHLAGRTSFPGRGCGGFGHRYNDGFSPYSCRHAKGPCSFKLAIWHFRHSNLSGWKHYMMSHCLPAFGLSRVCGWRFRSFVHKIQSLHSCFLSSPSDRAPAYRFICRALIDKDVPGGIHSAHWNRCL